MKTVSGFYITESMEQKHKKILINMIYKLLPIREEGSDWDSYLDATLLELSGFISFFEEYDEALYIRILSKLEGLKTLDEETDFRQYRKTVLECTNLIK